MSSIRSFRLLVLASAGDTEAAARDEALFMASCFTCHSVTREDNSKIGPNLVGLMGSKAGTTKSLLAPART